MGKTRKNFKDDRFGYEAISENQYRKERNAHKNAKKLDRAIKTKDIDTLMEKELDEFED